MSNQHSKCFDPERLVKPQHQDGFFKLNWKLHVYMHLLLQDVYCVLSSIML